VDDDKRVGERRDEIVNNDVRKNYGQKNYIKISIAGWLVGMLAASLYQNSFIYLMPIAVAVGIFIWPDRRKQRAKRSAREKNVLSSKKSIYIVFSVFAALAMFRFSITEEKIVAKIAALPFDKNIELVGMVVASSEAGTNGSQFIVKGVVKNNKENQNIISNISEEEIKFQVRESEGKEYSYGDMVVVKGKLEKPEPFETSTGGMFDYPNFLKKDGILGIVKVKTITVTETGKGNPILRTLIRFENNLENVLKTLIPGMKGSLTSGVLLGDKQITKENREEFITTGTTHIIALSGYNVSIVANFFKDMFSFLPLAGALAMGGIAIVLFVVMTGLQSSAVRAGIMGCIVLFAKAKGRQANIGLVLMLAAFVMTAVNPYTLYYDVSSQLSFLATVGIIYFAPTVSHWFTWLPEKKLGLPWREIAAGTIGTQMFVLPYILYKTGVLSIISPITNIAVLPFMPYLMAFGAVVAIVGIIFLPLAMPFALIAEGIAGAILFLIHVSTKIPLAAVPLVTPFWAMALMYIFLLYKFNPLEWRYQKKVAVKI
jgi:competence protein ComEC